MNTLLPIVTRELRARARQPRTFYLRVGAAALVILIVTGLLLFVTGFSGAGGAGQGLFAALVWLAYLFCLSDGLRNTADCLSEEKRSGTLGLLFLTDLRGYDVVLGKLIATSLTSFYVLLAILPPLAIPILLGGVTGGEFWRAALTLTLTLLFSLSTGLVVSAASREERRGWSLTIFILLVLAIVPPLLDFAARVLSASLPRLGALSPTTMLLALWDANYSANPARFWNACLGITVLTATMLAAASLILPRAWQDEVILTRAKDGPARRSREPHHTTMSPASVRRDRHLLAVNPVFWLANRTTGSPAFLWLLAGVGVLLGAVGAWLAQASLGGIVVVCLGLLALHYLMVARVAWEACHQFAGARDSGALELLLCTPLSPTAIISGHLNALNRLFLGPSLTMLGTALFLMALYSGGPSKSGPVIVTLLFWGIAFMDLYATAHFGLWMGLRMRKPSQALSRTLLYLVALPMLGAVFCWVIWPVVALVKNLVAMNYARDQLQRNFREVVAARYEPAGESWGALLPHLLPPKILSPPTLPAVLTNTVDKPENGG